MTKTKKFLNIILVIAILVVIFTPVTANASPPPFEDATITADEVNMRLRPTTESPVITQLPTGTRVGVFLEERDGWCRIIYGNYRGYVSRDYIFLPTVDYMVGHVLEDGLNLRQNPGTYSKILGKLTAGSGITIKNISGDWYYVEAGDKEGYVHKDYVKTSEAKTAYDLIKYGMIGAEVGKMQKELDERGFFGYSITNEFGEITKNALKAFQKKAGIAADGIAGEKTLELLYGDNDIKTNAAEMAGIKGSVRIDPWSKVETVFTKGTKALVTDVRTGLQFWVRRFGGWWHADSEPLTKNDTAIMKRIYGGVWSWDRRAIWVTVRGITYAASMNGMPHLSSPSKTNGFDGHFCIHFKDSKVHQTGRECPRHQYAVSYAYKKAQN